MQVDSTRLSCEERACRLAAGLCLYCAATDYYLGTCPIRPPRPAGSTNQSEPVFSLLSMLSVQLFTPVHSITASALVDMGSSGVGLQLHLGGSAQDLQVETIQGKSLGRGHMRYEVPPVKLKIGTLHEEEITFLLLEGPAVDIILGRPWLTLHSPEI